MNNLALAQHSIAVKDDAERLSYVLALPAQHQPYWNDHPELANTYRRLRESPPLVSEVEVAELRDRLAAAAAGEAVVLQAGDCAESFEECGSKHVTAKLDNLERLSAQFAFNNGQDVVTIGRLGGQFGKPRSSPTERHGDVDMPAFLGHIVNSEAPNAAAREPDPTRMLKARELSEDVLTTVLLQREKGFPPVTGRNRFGPWASHEALLLHYELPQIHRSRIGRGMVLGSTHLPWIGERTRQIDGAHVAMLSSIRNPVGCKLGPNLTAEEAVELCSALDPARETGRLVLICRMGEGRIEASLPDVVEAVCNAGHQAVWICDPMHGNTVTLNGGTKTRRLADIIGECRKFRRILDRLGVPAGGLHLETSHTEVTECLGGAVRDSRLLSLRYTTLCDPRLSPSQALEVINAATS